jgi:hypothetical protein
MRLNMHSRASLSAAALRPGYDPTRVGVSLVHLGMGGFRYARQAAHADAT